jgi:hypothetical protein
MVLTVPQLPALSLAWLVLPLVLAPWLGPLDRLGVSAARLVLAGLGLGALHVGVGTLELADLASYAAREGNGAFVSLTIGLLIGGALVPWDAPRSGLAWLASVPALLGGGSVVALGGLVPPVVLGMLLGAAPSLLGQVLRRGRRQRATVDWHMPRPAALGGMERAVALVVLSLAVLRGPVLLVTLGLGALLGLVGWRGRQPAGIGRWPVAAMVGMVGLLAFTWLAVTIAGNPLVPIRHYILAAPVSPAGEALLASFLVLALLGCFAPWPLHRLGDARATLPIAVAFAHGAAAMMVPDALRGWMPIWTMVLVPAAVVAVARRRWDGAAGALAGLAAVRPGTMALLGALGVILWPVALALRPVGRGNPHPGERVTFPGVRVGVTAAAVGAALTVAVILTDEVLLGTLLAVGLAVAAPWADHRLIHPAADRQPAALT